MRTYWLMLNSLVSLFFSLSVIAGVEEVYNLIADIDSADKTSHFCFCVYKEKGPEWCAACNILSGSSRADGSSHCKVACFKCHKKDHDGCACGPCGTVYKEEKISEATKIWKAFCGLAFGSCSHNPEACDCGLTAITCCKDDSEECTVAPAGLLYKAKQIGTKLNWKFLAGCCFGENDVQESGARCKMGTCGVACLDCQDL